MKGTGSQETPLCGKSAGAEEVPFDLFDEICGWVIRLQTPQPCPQPASLPATSLREMHAQRAARGEEPSALWASTQSPRGSQESDPGSPGQAAGDHAARGHAVPPEGGSWSGALSSEATVEILEV